MKSDDHGNERLLHLTVKHIHQEREQGDLLDDTPNFECQELKKLVENRDAWREMVHKLRDGSGIKITMTPSSTYDATRRRRRTTATETPTEASATATATVSATTAAASINDAQKYRDRDTHELFFRPSTIAR